ncbi:MAG: NYN domain-containing protein, partial [Actinomycetia bacterium]|nr:NYN domain-containing protein [Actinomycetes bacterium]
RRLALLRSEQEIALHRRQKAEEASRAGLLRTVGQYEAQVRSGEHERRGLAERVDELEVALEIAEERVARSTERATRRRAPVSATRDVHLAQPPKDPVAFAAWLDTVERIQRPYREAKRVNVIGNAPCPITIPSGIQPDTREAFSAVMQQQPSLVIIDGYNVSATFMHQDFSSHAARASVIAKAERLAASCRSGVVVVFDSSEAEGRSSFRSTGGVDVVFSRNRTADDEIVEIVESAGERTVVVTTDRELRERCTQRGAVPLWSNAFVDWANC